MLRGVGFSLSQVVEVYTAVGRPEAVLYATFASACTEGHSAGLTSAVAPEVCNAFVTAHSPCRSSNCAVFLARPPVKCIGSANSLPFAYTSELWLHLTCTLCADQAAEVCNATIPTHCHHGSSDCPVTGPASWQARFEDRCRF